jgi:hypothetical protein
LHCSYIGLEVALEFSYHVGVFDVRFLQLSLRTLCNLANKFRDVSFGLSPRFSSCHPHNHLGTALRTLMSPPSLRIPRTSASAKCAVRVCRRLTP